MRQVDGVRLATIQVLRAAGVEWVDGATPILSFITQNQTRAVCMIVNAALISGEIEMKTESRAKYHSEELMMGYTKGMVNNHHRKDPRMNGDTEYQAKNPGSRSGCGDTQLSALKKLKATRTDAVELAAIDAAITERQAEISATKTVTLTEAQLAALPASLRALLKV